MENKIALIIVIVNSGYSEKVMEVAKAHGAKGGTIFNAAGSASLEVEKLYGITINPEKEVILILVSVDLTNKLLKAFYENVGSSSPAQGIAFTLPVDEATSNLVNQYKEKRKTTN